MQPAKAERAASGVGVATLAIGGALAVAPKKMSRVLRIGDHPTSMRVIGLADMALVPGLLRGRPRWPWVVGRGVLNLVIAGYGVRLVRREGVLGAKIGVVAMVVLTVADGRVLRALRRDAASP